MSWSPADHRLWRRSRQEVHRPHRTEPIREAYAVSQENVSRMRSRNGSAIAPTSWPLVEKSDGLFTLKYLSPTNENNALARSRVLGWTERVLCVPICAGVRERFRAPIPFS